MQTPSPTLTFIFLIFSSLIAYTSAYCNQLDHNALLSFHHQISSPCLNWSASTDCCQWEGVTCTANTSRVAQLSLPDRQLSGSISPSLANLSFLSYLNLSNNQISGSLPANMLHQLNHLQVLDLSFNHLSGSLQPDSLPFYVQTVDLSNNRFNGSIVPSFLHLASNLVSLNLTNNTLTGPIPTWICRRSPLLEMLDFSSNELDGEVVPGIGECSRLRIFRAGSNKLSGYLPSDIFSVKTVQEISLSNNQFSGPINDSVVLLSNLKVLELHVNELTGEIPSQIGFLKALNQLQLHTNNLNGTLPPSLTDCSNLTTLLLRNNHLSGEISALDFSKLELLEAIDLGNNSFVGNIPESLCLCRSVTAIRLAYNHLVGELPPCFALLRSLGHLSLSDNNLSNVVGALKIVVHCDNLAVLFMSRCFHDEMMPDDDDLLHVDGFRNLQILTLGGCRLKGEIPTWISKLRKLKVLNLSYNLITGPIPPWLGDMPSLFIVKFTQNYLTGNLPREIGRLPALIADDTSSDLSYLTLPFLFDSNQYNRLFNLPRGFKVGNNSLSGSIPAELGRLVLLRMLDLSHNNFSGRIPDQLSNLVNLEKLDMSGNHLSGEIPISLEKLHFLSSFSVADNDLQGEIPRAGQFDTFSNDSFQGNPDLCGYVLNKSCLPMTQADPGQEDEEEDDDDYLWIIIPFGMGYFVAFFVVCITFVWRTYRGSSNRSGLCKAC